MRKKKKQESFLHRALGPCACPDSGLSHTIRLGTTDQYYSTSTVWGVHIQELTEKITYLCLSQSVHHSCRLVAYTYPCPSHLPQPMLLPGFPALLCCEQWGASPGQPPVDDHLPGWLFNHQLNSGCMVARRLLIMGSQGWGLAWQISLCEYCCKLPGHFCILLWVPQSENI